MSYSIRHCPPPQKKRWWWGGAVQTPICSGRKSLPRATHRSSELGCTSLPHAGEGQGCSSPGHPQEAISQPHNACHLPVVACDKQALSSYCMLVVRHGPAPWCPQPMTNRQQRRWLGLCPAAVGPMRTLALRGSGVHFTCATLSCLTAKKPRLWGISYDGTAPWSWS